MPKTKRFFCQKWRHLLHFSSISVQDFSQKHQENDKLQCKYSSLEHR